MSRGKVTTVRRGLRPARLHGELSSNTEKHVTGICYEPLDYVFVSLVSKLNTSLSLPLNA